MFTTIFDPQTGEGVEPYALYLFCGLLPWTWFSSSLIESSNSLIDGGNLNRAAPFVVGPVRQHHHTCDGLAAEVIHRTFQSRWRQPVQVR